MDRKGSKDVGEVEPSVTSHRAVVANTQVPTWGNTVDGGYHSPREKKGGERAGRTRDMMI